MLAAVEGLRGVLGINIIPSWKIPVEDQNQNRPPKIVIEELFQKYGKKYKETVDAPLILGYVNYQEIANRCHQSFKPFVEFLTGL